MSSLRRSAFSLQDTRSTSPWQCSRAHIRIVRSSVSTRMAAHACPVLTLLLTKCELSVHRCKLPLACMPCTKCEYSMCTAANLSFHDVQSRYAVLLRNSYCKPQLLIAMAVTLTGSLFFSICGCRPYYQYHKIIYAVLKLLLPHNIKNSTNKQKLLVCNTPRILLLHLTRELAHPLAPIWAD